MVLADKCFYFNMLLIQKLSNEMSYQRSNFTYNIFLNQPPLPPPCAILALENNFFEFCFGLNIGVAVGLLLLSSHKNVDDTFISRFLQICKD